MGLCELSDNAKSTRVAYHNISVDVIFIYMDLKRFLSCPALDCVHIS